MPQNAPIQERASRGRRVILVGALVNAFLALVKITGGVVGHSNALIADGLESTLDVISSTMVWGALKYAERPPDSQHPYGHGKMESLAGCLGALILLFAGGALALHSIAEIFFGEAQRPLPEKYTLIVLVVVVVIKETLFRVVRDRSNDVGSTAMKVDAWHHRSDAITSLAAAIGITIALVGGPAWISADSWAALFSCGFILFNGAHMLGASLSEVLDEQIPEEERTRIIQTAHSVPGVRSVEKCRARKSGLTLLADLHVRVDADISVRAGHEIAHLVKDRLLEADLNLSDVTVHIEPE